jgi:mRNA-degrading endonuclease YafQ of YafQ-DinJ toxin-antitoxin module
MRTVKYTSRFKRDYEREKSGRQAKALDGLLTEVVPALAADRPFGAGILIIRWRATGATTATAISGRT